jgi:CheY-like chemotaxis protein/DNA-binding CsgD family transcriptional regulator
MPEQKKILVVDDDPFVINIIFEILTQNNPVHIFYQANNGSRGFQVATLMKPNLIISDWDMPEMNGIEFIKLLKSNDATKDIPVIMATGIMTSSENLKTALNAGAVDFIRKPIDPIELRARVNSMLILSSYIEEIKQKNETVSEKNNFLNELINTTPYPIAYYMKNGECIIHNKTFNEIFNKANCTDGSFYSLFLKDGVDIHYKSDRRIIENGEKLINYECQVTYPDNTVHDIVFTKSPFLDKNQKIMGIICIMSDVTHLKKAHREALEKQKNELANISMRLIQSCELNDKIINDISQLNEHTSKRGNELIREIINNYKYAINDNIWEEFEKRFNDVHSNFYKKLSETYTDLTPNERKLCAFIKLNLSSKEIASITFQNVKSIDMARYRLRKKLGLSEEDNLVTFISNFG